MQKKQLEVSPFLQKNATLLKVALAAAEGIKLDTAVASTSAAIVSPSAARAMVAEEAKDAKEPEGATKAPPPSPECNPEKPKEPEPAPKVEAPKAPNTINHPHATKPITVSNPKPAPKPERPTVQVVGGRWF